MKAELKMPVAKRSAKKKRDNKGSSIIFRTSTPERQLIEKAAASRDLELGVYARQSSLKQAEMDLADRKEFIISDENMHAFLEALDRPVQNKPRLKRLLTEDSILD